MQTNPDKLASGNRGSANKDEMDKGDSMQGIPDWLQPFTDNLEDLETDVPAHSSERELRFGRCCKSGDKTTEAQYLYSILHRTKLRRVLEDQNYEGSLQKT